MNKRINPHCIVNQVCPLLRGRECNWKVLTATVTHKHIVAFVDNEFPTKRHARWAQHLFCTKQNERRLRIKQLLILEIEKALK